MTNSEGPGRGGAAPLRLAPFRALHYNPARVSDLGAVTCPPYDVIGAHGVAHWEAADPHNVVRLILPHDGTDTARYAAAARDLRAWLDDGLLVRDGEPALYVYLNTTGGGTAVGLVGAISLHDPAERRILPHEDVFAEPVADRAALMATTGAQLEPILLTYEGGGPASDAVDSAVGTRPFLEARTADGGTHRLWRLTDPAVLSAVAADLAGRQALIADGHHRYAAYLRLRDRGGPAAYGLAMLVDARRHPLRLDAVHRSVAGLSLDDATSAAARGFRRVAEISPDEVAGTLARAGLGGPAFAIGDGDGWRLLAEPDPDLVDACLPAGRSARWRGLGASIARDVLLACLWAVDDADPRVGYHHRAADAVARAGAEGGVALLLNPATLADVMAIAAGGERMPRKSTSFGPKPRTGLLMRLIDG